MSTYETKKLFELVDILIVGWRANRVNLRLLRRLQQAVKAKAAAQFDPELQEIAKGLQLLRKSLKTQHQVFELLHDGRTLRRRWTSKN